MLTTKHEPELEARSVQAGGPITLIQGAEMIVVDAEVLRTILEQHDPEPEPCDAEEWSWNIFRSEQVDPYWIRCTRAGPHDAHEDSNTGATWKN